MKGWITGLCCVLALFLFFSCGSEKKAEETAVDLPQIQERKELVVLTVNSSVSYFHYRGEPMGFQYELAQQFAKSLGLDLKVKVVKDEEQLVSSLLKGEGDLVAYNLIITNPLKDSLIYCGEEDITRQVIIQRRGKKALKDVTELVGKKVYVNSGKYRTRLENLNRELGGGIDICEISSDSVSSEDLITWVAEGRIDYTVATDEIARINRTYYPVLDINLAISFDQRSSWARRYFELAKRPAHGAILSVKDGKISHYDDLFRRYAKEIGWDWRLLASLAYTESNFNPNVVSWAGAKGLMQLMPATARAMGVPPGKEQDPEESIKAAVKYIAGMQRTFSKITDKEEQAKFILAAYNSGIGHVTDAMALAEKYGRNRYIWEHHVAHFMLLKSNKEYYQDPVCKNGYARGSDTYEFVHEILARAELYRKKIKK